MARAFALWGATLVRGLHLAIIAAAALLPFLGSCAALAAYAVLAPGLWAHWLLNQDACVLTALECWLRDVPARRSFFHALLAPLFNFHDGADAWLRRAVWLASVALWALALRRLGARCCEPEVAQRGRRRGGTGDRRPAPP